MCGVGAQAVGTYSRLAAVTDLEDVEVEGFGGRRPPRYSGCSPSVSCHSGFSPSVSRVGDEAWGLGVAPGSADALGVAPRMPPTRAPAASSAAAAQRAERLRHIGVCSIRSPTIEAAPPAADRQ